MKRGTSWKADQKKLEAWRFWNATAEYAFHMGEVEAVKICQPDVDRSTRLTWRAIDKATRELRAKLGIAGKVWEALPEIKPVRVIKARRRAPAWSVRRRFVTPAGMKRD